MSRILPILFLMCLLASSCEKEELPVPPYDRGDAIGGSIFMQETYQHQVWFELSSNTVRSTNEKETWHLTFRGQGDTMIVYLNPSLLMQAARTNATDLSQVTSAPSTGYIPDHPGGEPDSLGIGRTWTGGGVYIVDLGYTAAGAAIGRRKLQFTKNPDGTILLRYARLNGDELKEISIPSAAQDRLYYSLTDHQWKSIEPPAGEYDLLFTQYTHVFYEPYTPYLVTGVWIDPETVAVAVDSTSDFASIGSGDLENYHFESRRDAIGYDWKEYNFNSGLFEIDSKKVYLIRDSKGFYYKLRFTDFYDSAGKKGNPVFEFQKL